MSSAYQQQARREDPKQHPSAAFLNRDVPLFTSRRSLHINSLTSSAGHADSLLPSPVRSPSSPGKVPQRQYRDGRVLSLPRRETPDLNPESKSANENLPPSPSLSAPLSRQQSGIPRPAKPSGGPATPVRERAIGVAAGPGKIPMATSRLNLNPGASPSPHHSNSPRSLTGAWNRAGEEETEAERRGGPVKGAEQPADRASLTELHSGRLGRPENGDAARLERMRNSPSPFSSHVANRLARNEQRGSPVSRDNELDHDTMDTASTISLSSMFDDGTLDTLDQEIANHARDQRRINGALRSEIKAFSKAKVGERVGLTAENSQRKNGTSSSLSDDFEAIVRERNFGSGRIEPSVSVPNGWGRKGKVGRDWLRKSLATEIEKNIGAEELALIDGKAQIKEEPYWLKAAADVPLPSAEELTPPALDIPLIHESPSVLRSNSSLERIRGWEEEEEQEFTTRSLQMSTSPLINTNASSKNNNALNLIRNLEIESLKGRAVATSRLGEIRERTSREQLRTLKEEPTSKEADLLKPTGLPDYFSRSKPDIAEETSEDESPPRTEATDEGNAIPNTPIVIYKKKDSIRRGVGGEEIAGIENEAEKKADQQDILRRLAKATSASPSPMQPASGKEEEEEEVKRMEDEKDEMAEKETVERDTKPLEDEAEPANLTFEWIDSQAIPVPRPVTAAKPSLLDSAVFVSRKPPRLSAKIPRSSISEQSSKDEGETPKATPRKEQDTPSKPTPAMIGSWMDTPKLNNEPPATKDNPEPISINLKADSEASTNPTFRDFIRGSNPSPLSKKKASVPFQAQPPTRQRTPSATSLPRVSKHTDNNQDSTLDSLEDLIAADAEAKANAGLDDTLRSLILSEDDAAIDISQLCDEQGQMLSDGEKGRQRETLTFERLTKRLRLLGLSIGDARRGIEGLERTVEASANSQEKHTVYWACSHCGGMGPPAGAVHYCSGPHWGFSVPKMYTWRKDQRYPKITWFGVLWLLFLVFLLSERVCAEKFSESMYQPPFPFATVSFLRETKPELYAPIHQAWMWYGEVMKFLGRSLLFLCHFFGAEALGVPSLDPYDYRYDNVPVLVQIWAFWFQEYDL
ncbi:MAG: hypothetical protein M1829_000269 [Trizodia sp. TS-e1964]|nr:MAG: hypothetical protein M1829_000269 [Trizodia sp. TS-e1964]